MKVVSINIYKSPLGDCTNEGASSKFNELYLFSEDSKLDEIIKYINDKHINWEQCFRVETIDIYGVYKRAKPALRHLYKGLVGPMAGGNYGFTSDARYWEVTDGLRYPISIHDRFETEEEYRLLNM